MQWADDGEATRAKCQSFTNNETFILECGPHSCTSAVGELRLYDVIVPFVERGSSKKGTGLTGYMLGHIPDNLEYVTPVSVRFFKDRYIKKLNSSANQLFVNIQIFNYTNYK